MSTAVICEDIPHIRKLIRARSPDLVVSDLAMRVLDGIAPSDRVRADPALAHIPIVFLTASTRPNLVAAAPAGRPVAGAGT